MSTLKEILTWGRSCLQENKIENGRMDAWYLLEHVLRIDRNYYFLHQDDIIEEKQATIYESLIEKRSEHVPLQQLIGEASFMGLDFFVNEHVLAPRQDTETLVETALKRLEPESRVLDVCTGSGCIILSLMCLGTKIQGTGSDLSSEALAVAEKNARRFSCPLQLVESDLFEKIEGIYDMIVSNPPYIRRDVIPTLMEEVREHEPMMALDGGEDGLDFYRAIIREGKAYLKQEGWLGFEIGYDQGEAVSDLFRENSWRHIEVVKDLSGLDRVVWAMRPVN